MVAFTPKDSTFRLRLKLFNSRPKFSTWFFLISFQTFQLLFFQLPFSRVHRIGVHTVRLVRRFHKNELFPLFAVCTIWTVRIVRYFWKTGAHCSHWTVQTSEQRKCLFSVRWTLVRQFLLQKIKLKGFKKWKKIKKKFLSMKKNDLDRYRAWYLIKIGQKWLISKRLPTLFWKYILTFFDINGLSRT